MTLGNPSEKKDTNHETAAPKEARIPKPPFLRDDGAYTLLGGSLAQDGEDDAANLPSSTDSMEKLEQYAYFLGDGILSSVHTPGKTILEGRRLIKEGTVRILHVMSGFSKESGEVMGELLGEGAKGLERFPIRLVFSRAKIKAIDCGCPKCRSSYYWLTERNSCPYTAGVLLLLRDYLKEHPLGDATDAAAQRLLHSYSKRSANRVTAEAMAAKRSLQLVPRLTKRDGELSASFKIGEKKLFIIKKLDVFCQNVKNLETDVYGANTKINHNPDQFTDKGKKWLHFIHQVVLEEEKFQKRLSETRHGYYYRKASVGSELSLFGWRLDEFYRQMGEDAVEYDDKDEPIKHKRSLSRTEKDPKVSMQIKEEAYEGDSEFHGVHVTGQLPNLYFGTADAYYVTDRSLAKVSRSFLEKIEPLAGLAKNDCFSFHVGRNHMSEFYYKTLPLLEEIVDITETDPEKFRQYLPPDVKFTFYLDASNQNATCRVCARYGEREFSSLDVLLKESEDKKLEPFRDAAKEGEAVFQALELFPNIDQDHDELHCGGDEDRIYQIMESGADTLMELGEVRCTKQFLNYRSVKPVKVSVGVSVSSGLLELDIATEDISHAELLDILNSYRAKKTYYRRKDGSFINLGDPSLETLTELMDAARLKPKDFVKGKMHLPMYRTLYLDKMLEESESLYSHRDRHFKNVVKSFKTVKDADFEEPEGLSDVMRPYQKNGYQWLRTLEAWQFGGILADDMGLGKTLQVIAVLLAAKQEGKQGTSLVVSPASLAFNWSEEFHRFAPGLSVSLITGTQGDRKKKIDAYQDFDVLVTSYDLLKRDILHYEEKQFLYEVIDEAQYIKNHTTAAAKAVKVIQSQVRYALTGTPIENRLSELWSIFDYLMPGFLYGYDVFKREMETPIVKNGDEKALKRLQKMAGPFILRRLKEDVLKDLPEKLEERRYVRFEGTQQKLYDGQVIHMKEQLAAQNESDFNKNKMLVLAELTKLRQICCDPSLCLEGYKGGAAKTDACLELISSAMDGGHRMLVFSQFTSMLHILQEKLDLANIPYFVITGATPKEKRLTLVKEFNTGKTPVFLISLKAGGVGLNLTGADVVIHFDPWWNLAVQNQATDRAHRIGQTKKVTVYQLIAKGTIEEKIQSLQEKKKDLAEQVIGGEAQNLGSLSKEELLELLEA